MALVAEAYDRLDADCISVFAFNNLTQMLECVISQDIKGMQIDVSRGVVGSCFRSSQIMHVISATDSEDHCGEVDKATNIRTKNIICSPILSVSGVAVGVVQALNKRSGNWFTKEDESVIREIAQRLQETGILDQCNKSMRISFNITGQVDDSSHSSFNLSAKLQDHFSSRALVFLIVDEDRGAANILKHSLEKGLRHDAEVVSNLRDALEKVRPAAETFWPFDAMFVDTGALVWGREAASPIAHLVKAGASQAQSSNAQANREARPMQLSLMKP